MRAISLAVATFFGLSLLVGCSLNDPPAVSSTPAETTAAPKEAGRSAEDIDGEGDPSSPSTTAAEVPSAEATEAAAAPTPLPPDANPALAVVGEVLIADGEPGQLSIVAQATSLERSGSLPIVVRNLTSEPIASLEVTGTIRDASGALAASGADQGLHPNLVGPGEIAIGYVYFGIDELPVDASFDLTVTGSDPSEIWAGRVDLIVSEHNLTADSVVVMLKNETEAEVTGPIGLMMMCFDEQGLPIGTHSAYAEPDVAAAGGSVSASFEFYNDPPCARYIVGGSGYDF